MLWFECVFLKAYEWKVCLPTDGPVIEGPEKHEKVGSKLSTVINPTGV